MSNSPRSTQRWLGSVLIALAMTATAGSASAEDGILTWIARSIAADEDGDIIPAAAMQVPQDGIALAVGQRISTRAGERMVLVNGRDLVEVMPNTTFTVGDDDPMTPTANLDVVSGTIHVEAGKRKPGQTFSVGASFLVATVKGTQFDVSASSMDSSVRVTEGIVGVSSAISGESVDVTAGDVATVRRGQTGKPSLVRMPGALPSSIPASSTTETAAASASDIAGHGGSRDGGSSGGGSSAGGSKSGGSDSGGSGSSGSGGSSSGGSTSGGGLGGAVGGAVGGAADAVGGAIGGATGAVGGAVSGATGAVGGAVGGALGGAVSGLGGAVGDGVSRLGGAVGGAVGGLGGKLGGALGGGGNK